MSNLTTELITLRWWQSMFLPTTQLKEKGLQAAPTFYKAQLKRCDSINAIMLTEGFRELWLSLPQEIIESTKTSDIECWATLAGALVHVKTDSKNKFSQVAGSKREGDKSLVSELRFTQLQNAKTPDEFLGCLRRILQQVKNKVSVTALVKDIRQWFDEYHSLRPEQAEKPISVQWTIDYYRAASEKK